MAVQKILKPIIYLFSPTAIKASVVLRLTPQWGFSAVYPPTIVLKDPKGDSVHWDVNIQPSGTLLHNESGTEVSYLYWEALTKPSGVADTPLPPPSLGLHPATVFNPAKPELNLVDSIIISTHDISRYLDKVLLSLGLHTEARTSFISFWLPALLKHAHVALRFLPQGEYETAAALTIIPAPALVTRVFMLFKGVAKDEVDDLKDALKKEEADWAKIIGSSDASVVCSGEGLRIMEWGGMEVCV